MWQTLQPPLMFSLAAAAAASLGLFLVSFSRDWSERRAGVFALAAGGMLIGVTLLQIAPEALEHSHEGGRLLLAGFLAGLLLNALVSSTSGAGLERPGVATAVTPLIAIAVHSFLDGAIYSVAFAARYEAGVLAAAPLILHEIPEGVIAFVILRRGGLSARQSAVWAFAAAAATTPLGVLVASPLIHVFGQEAVYDLFGVSAGLLLFVATGPLMAPLRDTSPARALPALGLGVAAALALTALPFGHAALHAGH